VVLGIAGSIDVRNTKGKDYREYNFGIANSGI
jgi:hypothetical protein